METHKPNDDKTMLFGHVRDFLSRGLSIQCFSGMTPERLLSMFEHAKAVYREGSYAFALEIFKFLCLQNHLNKTYFMYLGACYQQMERPGMAVKAYTHASALDPSDPRPHYNAAICYLAENQLEAAEEAVLMAQAQHQSVYCNDDLKHRMTRLLMTINHHKNRAA